MHDFLDRYSKRGVEENLVKRLDTWFINSTSDCEIWHNLRKLGRWTAGSVDFAAEFYASEDLAFSDDLSLGKAAYERLLKLGDTSPFEERLTGTVDRAALRARNELEFNRLYRVIYNEDSLSIVGIELPLVNVAEADAWQDASTVTVSVVREKFVPPLKDETVYATYRREAAHGDLNSYDAPHAKVVGLDEQGIVFQSVFYSTIAGTNHALMDDPPEPGSYRALVNPNGRLDQLGASTLAHDLGINGLGITSDGFLVLQIRKPNVIARPNEVCSTFSGGLKLTQFGANPNRVNFLNDIDFLAELSDETNNKDVSQFFMLGVLRELWRGGKPEMFFCFRFKETLAEVEGRFPETERKEGRLKSVPFDRFISNERLHIRENVSWQQVLSAIEAECEGRKLSMPLLANLLLMFRPRRLPLN